jgi:hypothetical protein
VWTVTEAQERGASVDKVLNTTNVFFSQVWINRVLGGSDGFMATRETKGVVGVRRIIVIWITMDRVLGNTDLNALGNVRAVGKSNAFGSHDHLLHTTYNEAAEAGGLTDSAVEVMEFGEECLRPDTVGCLELGFDFMAEDIHLVSGRL